MLARTRPAPNLDRLPRVASVALVLSVAALFVPDPTVRAFAIPFILAALAVAVGGFALARIAHGAAAPSFALTPRKIERVTGPAAHVRGMPPRMTPAVEPTTIHPPTPAPATDDVPGETASSGDADMHRESAVTSAEFTAVAPPRSRSTGSIGSPAPAAEQPGEPMAPPKETQVPASAAPAAFGEDTRDRAGPAPFDRGVDAASPPSRVPREIRADVARHDRADAERSSAQLPAMSSAPLAPGAPARGDGDGDGDHSLLSESRSRDDLPPGQPLIGVGLDSEQASQNAPAPDLHPMWSSTGWPASFEERLDPLAFLRLTREARPPEATAPKALEPRTAASRDVGTEMPRSEADPPPAPDPLDSPTADPAPPLRIVAARPETWSTHHARIDGSSDPATTSSAAPVDSAASVPRTAGRSASSATIPAPSRRTEPADDAASRPASMAQRASAPVEIAPSGAPTGSVTSEAVDELILDPSQILRPESTAAPIRSTTERLVASARSIVVLPQRRSVMRILEPAVAAGDEMPTPIDRQRRAALPAARRVDLDLELFQRCGGLTSDPGPPAVWVVPLGAATLLRAADELRRFAAAMIARSPGGTLHLLFDALPDPEGWRALRELRLPAEVRPAVASGGALTHEPGTLARFGITLLMIDKAALPPVPADADPDAGLLERLRALRAEGIDIVVDGLDSEGALRDRLDWPMDLGAGNLFGQPVEIG